ncbi:MAG TPA: ABC transporter substrate-binding protein [Stellaceae bacterium]|nr:ABC transporter substrate-binding protein [Stellaceae bacterium]
MRRRSLLARGAAAAVAVAVGPLLAPFAAGEEAKKYELAALRYQGWASRVTFPELAADLGYLAPLTLKWVGNTISGPQDIQAAVTGDTDFGGAFHTAIERLIAAGAPIKAVIGVSGTDKETWPGLYVLSGGAIKGPRDLIGKKIAVNTLGAHDEFMIDVYLQRHGLSQAEIGQVTLVPMPPASAEHVLRLKQVDAAILGDVYRDKAMATGGLDLLFNDYQLFGALTTGSYILTEKFIADYPNTTRRFVEATARAIDWTQTKPRAVVIARFQDIIKKRGRDEDPSIVTYWKSAGLAGRGGLLTDRSFGLYIDWFRANGDTAIGRLKPHDLYTNAFNPYRDSQS